MMEVKVRLICFMGFAVESRFEPTRNLIIRSIMAALLLVLAVGAQEQGRYEIEGRVVDGETGIPIAGVAVTAMALDVTGGVLRGAKRDPGAPDDPYMTGLDGRFSIPVTGPGRYSIRARRDGYSSLFSTSTNVVEEGKTSEIRTELSRSATISGRVLRADDESPIKGAEVLDLAVYYRDGDRRFHSMRETTTDEHGVFRMEDLMPGEHKILVRSRAPDFEAIERRTRTDADTNDENGREGYYRMVWPQPGRESTGIFVIGGSETAVGDIRVERGEPATILGEAISSDCQAGDVIVISLKQSEELGVLSSTALGEQECGAPWRISRIPPGQYQLEAFHRDRTSLQRRHAFHVLDLAEGQVLETTLGLAAPLALNVGIYDTHGEPYQAEDELVLRAIPIIAQPFLEEAVQNQTGDGKGILLVFFRSPVEVSARGLRSNEYLKELNYNGTKTTRRTFLPDPNASGQELELTIGADAGMVTPVLSGDDERSSDTKVVIAPWPPDASRTHPEYIIREQTTDGTFETVWLPPGKHRAFAMSLPQPYSMNRPIDKPGVLLSILKGLPDIVVNPNDSKTVPVEYIPLR